MNEQRINPFNELYIAETIPAEQFVSLFSPYLVKDVEDGLPLFQPGNVVLKGVQGTGKSMLMNLLKPEFRLAYKKANADLPIPLKLSKFIGAGINLSRSVAIDFGQRVIEDDHFDIESLPIYFGDFLNYWVVEDLLNSIDKFLGQCEGAVADELGISRDKGAFDRFASLLAAEPCWFGYLEKVRTFNQLKAKIVERISTYRSFLNYNIPSLPVEIRSSKTPIGEPISRTAEALWEAGIVPRDVSFFIRIDQYEELLKLEDWSTKLKLGLRYREIVNKALSTRDPRISYRIGTRRYGWQDLRIFRTASELELERDYKVVDIDAILRRQENSHWGFPDFARDVFERRAAHSGYNTTPKSFDLFLGDGYSVEEKASSYSMSQPEEAHQERLKVPRKWTKVYSDLLKNEPLEARLLEGWVLQNGREKLTNIEAKRPFPWARKWWRKERIQHALMQVASQRRQRMLWAGKDEVLALSGGNILVLVGICQNIWAAWVRANRGRGDAEFGQGEVPQVEPRFQTVGIHEASTQQYHKIEQKTGESTKRRRFIDFLGRFFRQHMVHDRSLSYPGHNGFSLQLNDLNSDELIKTFLEDAVDYGDLYDSPHTTKTKDKLARRKWYLNPIFSPHFQLPVTHVKEPMYVTVRDVRRWLVKAERVSGLLGEVQSSSDGDQLPLFGRKDRTINR